MTACTFAGGALTCQEASCCLTFCNEWSLFVKWRNSGKFTSFLSPSSSPLGVTIPSDSDGVLCHSACHRSMSVLSLPLVFQSRGDPSWRSLVEAARTLRSAACELASFCKGASVPGVGCKLLSSHLPQSRGRTVSHTQHSLGQPISPRSQVHTGAAQSMAVSMGNEAVSSHMNIPTERR